MEKKKGRKKKIRFNYFMKRKIIIGICLFLVLVGGIVTVFALTNKDEKGLDNKQNEVDKTIPAECPYTLDELEKAITSGWLFDKYAVRDYAKEADDMAFVLFHFYDYFSKETEFTVWDTFNSQNGEVTYKKISYDEYMKYRDTYLYYADKQYQEGTHFAYVVWLKNMMFKHAKFI